MSNFAIEMKRILSVLLLILAYSSASAQFLVGGGDPPGVVDNYGTGDEYFN